MGMSPSMSEATSSPSASCETCGQLSVPCTAPSNSTAGAENVPRVIDDTDSVAIVVIVCASMFGVVALVALVVARVMRRTRKAKTTAPNVTAMSASNNAALVSDIVISNQMKETESNA